MEERIGRVRENFHLQRPARIEDLTVLHKKVDQLTRKVDQLTRALIDQGAIKAPRKKKAAAGKTTTKKAAVRKKSATGAKTTTRKRKA